MDRRSLLKWGGVLSVVGGLAGCTSDSTGARTETPDSTAATGAAFSGNWGLPACSDNPDARVVIQNYDPEQGIGHVYNRTSTNLLVSILNDAGSLAKDNQGNLDMYVPFGESEPFRSGGRLQSVVTMTESRYTSRDTVDWLNRHDREANQGCTLPAGDRPSAVELTPKDAEREADRVKDRVRDAADETTDYERVESTTSGRDSTATATPGAGVVGTIQDATKSTTGIRVTFSVEAGRDAPESVSYTLRVLTRGDERYPQSGRLSLEPNSTVSETIAVEFSEFDASTEYAVELSVDGAVQDVRIVD